VPFVFRSLTPDDAEHVRWALLAALAWNPERRLPPGDVVLEHPEAVRYHRDWGRPGDFGVLAERDGEVVGVAYARTFTDEDHGHGYVDERTPELAIAVREDARGAGLGAALLQELAALARSEGFEQVSLSVDTENPAARLYERLGYREVFADADGRRMLLELR
jgi:ribosomal protein S18 acetylase RimI-like enzyme